MTNAAFGHAPDLRAKYPELVAGILRVDGVTADVETGHLAAPFIAAAKARLAGRTESDLPEVGAWRRVFARMGLKPTQYRCASEALLRRLRLDGALPAIHPLIDLANAVSMAFAIPVAVFDRDRVAGSLTVRFADGTERYEAFSGEIEAPETGEVVFCDDEGWAHARRWTNRQSGRSAVRAGTSRVLLVAEGVHPSADTDVPRLLEALTTAIGSAWPAARRVATLGGASSSLPRRA